MDVLYVPINAATVGILLTLIGILLTILRGYIKTNGHIQVLITQQTAMIAQNIINSAERKETILECNKKHDQHFLHASNTGIHQESMSEKTLIIHFESITKQITDLNGRFTGHIADDMEVLKDIRVDLREIRGLVQK